MLLLVRRILAFVIDCAPAVSVWIMIASLRLLGVLSPPSWTDHALYLFLFVYLGITESLTGGQSLGKSLLGIRVSVLNATSTWVVHFQRAIAHAALAPAAFVMGSFLAVVMHSDGAWFTSVTGWVGFILLSQLFVLWLTGGRAGFVDLALGTRVERSENPTDSPSVVFPYRRAATLAVGGALILSILIASAGVRVWRLLSNELDRSHVRDQAVAWTARYGEILVGLLPQDVRPESAAVGELRPCAVDDHVEMRSSLPHLFLPSLDKPVTISDCWDVTIEGDWRLLLSSDVRLAAGVAVDTLLRAEDGPFAGKPRPTLVLVSLRRTEVTGFLSFHVAHSLHGYFVPDQGARTVLLDSWTETGVGSYLSEGDRDP